MCVLLRAGRRWDGMVWVCHCVVCVRRNVRACSCALRYSFVAFGCCLRDYCGARIAYPYGVSYTIVNSPFELTIITR